MRSRPFCGSSSVLALLLVLTSCGHAEMAEPVPEAPEPVPVSDPEPVPQPEPEVMLIVGDRRSEREARRAVRRSEREMRRAGAGEDVVVSVFMGSGPTTEPDFHVGVVPHEHGPETHEEHEDPDHPVDHEHEPQQQQVVEELSQAETAADKVEVTEEIIVEQTDRAEDLNDDLAAIIEKLRKEKGLPAQQPYTAPTDVPIIEVGPDHLRELEAMAASHGPSHEHEGEAAAEEDHHDEAAAEEPQESMVEKPDPTQPQPTKD